MNEFFDKTCNPLFISLCVQRAENFPYMDALELLVNKGRNIPVRLELLPQLELQLNGAKTWKERTARTFLRKNSHYTLMEVSVHVVSTLS
jgi:histone demethylase JARID1